ncbi:MAG: SDR family NAD(P)-dependent oxidoreductase [Acidimicrobiia bacterium]
MNDQTDGSVFDVAGRVVAITGAAIGIGAAGARTFAEAGARVYLLDIDDDRAQAVAEGVGTYLHCDVTDASEVAQTFATIGQEAGGLDVLVNNAGGFWRQAGVDETTEDDWDRIVDLNLKSVFLCSRAAIPLLTESAAGRLINVGSLAGQTTMYRSAPAYAAAKAGVHALTRVLAYELAPLGITANALAPSAVLTDRILEVRDEAEREQTARSIPLGHYGSPQDIANVFLFLASDASAYLTGQTLAVNGGRFMI